MSADSRYAEVEANNYSNKYEYDEIASDLYGYVTASSGRDYDDVDKVHSMVYAPSLADPARKVYVVWLTKDHGKTIPAGVRRVMDYRELEATEVMVDDGQTRIVLEAE